MTAARVPELAGPAALERAELLAHSGQRTVLGITGPPGAGKSTLAAAVVLALGPRAVLVPMDGYHLAQSELERLGRSERKGAPDTFDAAGFVSLLERVRAQVDPAGQAGPAPDVVYAPYFDRGLEEPVAGVIAVEPDIPLVVVEGNYLLHDEGAWARVAPLLDETWYVEVADQVRIDRLVARHVTFGKAPEAARAWSLGPDESNARLIEASRQRATFVVRPDGLEDWRP